MPARSTNPNREAVASFVSMPVTGPVGLSWFGVATTRDGPPIRGIIRGTVSPRPRPRWVTAPFHPGDTRHSPAGSGRLGCHHEFLSRSSGPPAGSTGPPPAPSRLSPSGGRSISHAGSADHPVGWYARDIQSSVRLAGRSQHTPPRPGRPRRIAGPWSTGLGRFRVRRRQHLRADPVDVLLAWVVVLVALVVGVTACRRSAAATELEARRVSGSRAGGDFDARALWGPAGEPARVEGLGEAGHA